MWQHNEFASTTYIHINLSFFFSISLSPSNRNIYLHSEFVFSSGWSVCYVWDYLPYEILLAIDITPFYESQSRGCGWWLIGSIDTRVFSHYFLYNLLFFPSISSYRDVLTESLERFKISFNCNRDKAIMLCVWSLCSICNGTEKTIVCRPRLEVC